MSFAEKLLLPKRLYRAAYILIATLIVAIGFEYFTDFETFRLVKTVVYYLVLDYVWASVRREYFGDKV